MCLKTPDWPRLRGPVEAHHPSYPVSRPSNYLPASYPNYRLVSYPICPVLLVFWGGWEVEVEDWEITRPIRDLLSLVEPETEVQVETILEIILVFQSAKDLMK